MSEGAPRRSQRSCPGCKAGRVRYQREGLAPKRSSTRLDYTRRLNRVLDHVNAKLGEPPSLSELARVAGFSPFHFHRVFRSLTGETVRELVARVRLERAALLLGRAGTRRALTEVAFDCGFSSSAEFSRAFRGRFDMTPSAFRLRAQKSKNPQEPARPRSYLPKHDLPASRAQLVARIVAAPERHLAYVRVTDPFAPGRLAAAYRSLLEWAGAPVDVLGASQDDPDVTPLERCRYDVGCLVPEGTVGSGEVSVRRLPRGTYAEVEARGGLDDLARAWDGLFARWLPTSGYEPADGPGLERYREPPDFTTWRRFDVVLALPIVRARR